MYQIDYAHVLDGNMGLQSSKIRLLVNIVHWYCMFIAAEATGGYLDRCQHHTDCTVLQSQCIDSFCQCQAGMYYNSQQGSCLASSPFGGTCSMNQECGTYHSRCFHSECQCKMMMVYMNNTNACHDVISITATCTEDIDCSNFINAKCLQSYCACISPAYFDDDTGSCQLPGENFGHSCTRNSQCSTANSWCMGGTCGCGSRYYHLPEVDICNEMKPLGSWCEADTECDGDHTECNQVCTCVHGWFIHGTSCSQQKALGEYCADATWCLPQHAVCLSNTCSCPAVMHVTPDGKCIENMPTLNVECIDNCWTLANPDAELLLRIKCNNYNLDISKLVWSLYRCNGQPTCVLLLRADRDKEVHTSTAIEFIKDLLQPDEDYKVEIIVYMQHQIQLNEIYLFNTSASPQMGSCDPVPQTGYTLVTRFNIFCSAAENELFSYRLTYGTDHVSVLSKMIYMGDSANVTDLVLPVGLKDKDYTLYFRMIVFSENGASNYTQFTIQVMPAIQAPSTVEDELQVLENLLTVENDTGTSVVDDIIEAGNTAGAVQLLNAITATLNTAALNMTSHNVTNTTKTDEVQERKQLRTSTIEKIEKLKVKSFEMVQQTVEVLKETTKVKEELTKEAKKAATNMYSSLADGMKDYSENVSTSDIKDVASTILTGVDAVLRVDFTKDDEELKDDPFEDDSKMGDDKQDEPSKPEDSKTVQEEKERKEVKNSNTKILKTITKVATTLLKRIYTGLPPLVLETDSLKLKVEKKPASFLSGSIFKESVEKNGKNFTAGFTLPNMGLNLTEDDTVGIELSIMKNNPYIWDESADPVTSPVLCLSLHSDDGETLNVSDLQQPISITLPNTVDIAEDTSQEGLKQGIQTSASVIISEKNFTHTPHKSNDSLLVVNFTVPENRAVLLSVRPVVSNITVKMYLTKDVKPTFRQVIESGINPVTVTKDTPFTNLTVPRNISSETEADTNTLFLHQREEETTYYIGVLLDLSKTDQDVLRNSSLSNSSVMCIVNAPCIVDISYEVEVVTHTLSCVYWDELSDTWSRDGCQVSPQSTAEVTQCLCSHLTSFAASFLVVPNYVDPISDITVFLTFFDNPVVVSAVAFLWIVYFGLLQWAHRKDKLDKEKTGLLVCDNLSSTAGSYIYLICVLTGWRQKAGTTANVYIYLTGSSGKSHRQCLNTKHQACFKTGAEDWFLVTTEFGLGDILSITIWHDNSGHHPNWYLEQVLVKDVKMDKFWSFIHDDWLSVENGRLRKLTVTLTALSEADINDKSKRIFLLKSRRDLQDKHLWMSIFTKHPGSSFSRVQRLTCGLSVILMEMLANIMFHGIPTDDPADQVSLMEDFSVSLKDIIIGVECSILIFPANLILYQLFSRTAERQRYNHDDLLQVRQSYLEQLENIGRSMHQKIINETRIPTIVIQSPSPVADSEYAYSTDTFCSTTGFSNVSSVSDNIASKKSVSEEDKGGLSEKNGMIQNMDSDVPSGTVTDSKESLTSGGDKKHGIHYLTEQLMKPSGILVLAFSRLAKFQFPSWTLYIAWSFATLMCLGSSYVVMLYGLKYGYKQSLEWLVSFLTGFSSEFFLLQPLKVIAMAVLITLIMKRNIDLERHEPEKEIDDDEQFLGTFEKEIKRDPYTEPLAKKVLCVLRNRLRLKRDFRATVRDIMLYLTFMLVVLLMVYGHRDVSMAFYTNQVISNMFFKNHNINISSSNNFNKVHSLEDVYSYIKARVVPRLSDDTVNSSEGLDPTFFHLSPYRLRQLRINKGTCDLEPFEFLQHRFGGDLPPCVGKYSISNEDTSNYSGSWDQIGGEQSRHVDSWKYQRSWAMTTIPVSGQLATYSGGGYMVEMPEGSQEQLALLDDNFQSRWIDDRTRVVFVEFTLYNPNVDLFSTVIILFEFSNTGAAFPSYQLYTSRLVRYSTGFQIFLGICETLFLCLNFLFTFFEVVHFLYLGRSKYLSDPGRLVALLQILLSFAVIGLFLQRLLSFNSTMDKYREGMSVKFVDFYQVMAWDFLYGYITAFLVALITLKLLLQLKYNNTTLLFLEAMEYSKNTYIYFLLMMFVMFMAYGHFTTLVFGSNISEYRNIWISLLTLFNFSLGVSDYFPLQRVSWFLGPAYFASFIVLIIWCLLAVFLAIMNHAVSQVKRQAISQDPELLQYLKEKLKKMRNHMMR